MTNSCHLPSSPKKTTPRMSSLKNGESKTEKIVQYVKPKKTGPTFTKEQVYTAMKGQLITTI